MKLAFEATFVDCADAIDGELLQVTFDTVPPDRGEDGRLTPYVLISRLFEFPGTASIEWHDGRDYDGGAEIVSMALSRSLAKIRLDQGLEIQVAFSVPDKQYMELISFMRRMVGDRLVSCDPTPEPSSRANSHKPSRF